MFTIHVRFRQRGGYDWDGANGFGVAGKVLVLDLGRIHLKLIIHEVINFILVVFGICNVWFRYSLSMSLQGSCARSLVHT